MFNTIIFDFDGTLAHLNIDFVLMKRQITAIAEAFFPHGAPPSDLPVLEWVATLGQSLLDKDQDKGKEFLSRCRLLIVDQELRAAERGRLFPFTQMVLSDLQSLGVKLGVVSRNCTPAIKRVFPDILQYVDLLLARDDVQRVKPDPEHLLKAVQGLASNVGQTLLVGDHLLDIRSAKEVGMACAAVASGRLSSEELKKAEPDFWAENIADLISLLYAQGVLLRLKN